MKNVLFLVIFCLFAQFSFAESITLMSFSDASKLVEILKAEKYVLNYCDYCDKATATLVKMGTVSVEPSKEVADMYAVRLVGKKSMYFESDINANFIKASAAGEDFNDLVSLNESMITKYGRALPAGYFIGKTPEELKNVMDFVYYPNPTDANIFSALGKSADYEAYIEWHKSNVAPHLISRPFVGKFDATSFCETASFCKGLPPGLSYINFNIAENGTFVLTAGVDKDKASWVLENGKLITTDKNQVKTVYGYRVDGNVMVLRNFQYGLDPNTKESFRIIRLKKAK